KATGRTFSRGLLRQCGFKSATRPRHRFYALLVLFGASCRFRNVDVFIRAESNDRVAWHSKLIVQRPKKNGKKNGAALRAAIRNFWFFVPFFDVVFFAPAAGVVAACSAESGGTSGPLLAIDSLSDPAPGWLMACGSILLASSRLELDTRHWYPSPKSSDSARPFWNSCVNL